MRRYSEFDELTVRMLNEIVEKVVVHEGDKSSGKRIQKVDVYLNFIGRFDFQLPEKNAEELGAEYELDEKRRKARERQREYRERRKTKKVA